MANGNAGKDTSLFKMVLLVKSLGVKEIFRMIYTGYKVPTLFRLHKLLSIP